MKRLIVLAALLVATAAHANDILQWVTFGFTFTNDANQATTISNLQGTVERVAVDVSASSTNNMTIVSSGKVDETLLSLSAVAADAVYRPVKPNHSENGAVGETNTPVALYRENVTVTVTNVNNGNADVKVHILMRQE